MAISKLSKPQMEVVERDVNIDSFEYDFGALELVSVEVVPGKFLKFKEPTAEDFLKLQNFEMESKASDIETTLFTICLLHVPEEGRRKISMKEAKRLTAKQLKKIGEALKELTNDALDIDVDEEDEDFKS